MERQLWIAILQILSEVDKPKFNPRYTFSAIRIVEVWMWSVIHDRPTTWSCKKSSWPPHERRKSLPSGTTMSRRLRSADVRYVLEQIEKRVLRSNDADNKNNLMWMIDGKPLAISGGSKDRQAGYGRAAGGKAKGYKIHAILGANGSVAEWRMAPMNKDERVMADRMLKVAKIQGYVVTDGNYDSNKLHATCDERGNLQLVARRRYGKGRGLGNRKQTEGRLRSKDILENPDPRFGDLLLEQRNEIERYFGNLSNWGGGLNYLPPWCRTHRRVHRWVQAKMILAALKPRRQQTTYVD